MMQWRFCHCPGVAHATAAFAAQARRALCPSAKYEYLERFSYSSDCVTRGLRPGLGVTSQPRASKSKGTVANAPPAWKRPVRAAGRVRVHSGRLKMARQVDVCSGVFEKMIGGRKHFPEGDR